MSDITFAPVSVLVTGEKKLDRQLSVIHRASGEAVSACANMKGSAGKIIREGAARAGLVSITQRCATGDYRPLAEMLAIKMGEPIFISSRASFESLPDVFSARIEKAKMAKNGGMREDKKTGAMVPGARLALEMELRATCVEVIRAVGEIVAERQARKATEQASLAA